LPRASRVRAGICATRQCTIICCHRISRVEPSRHQPCQLLPDTQQCATPPGWPSRGRSAHGLRIASSRVVRVRFAERHRPHRRGAGAQRASSALSRDSRGIIHEHVAHDVWRAEVHGEDARVA
jgi:hypothetical protein